MSKSALILASVSCAALSCLTVPVAWTQEGPPPAPVQVGYALSTLR